MNPSAIALQMPDYLARYSSVIAPKRPSNKSNLLIIHRNSDGDGVLNDRMKMVKVTILQFWDIILGCLWVYNEYWTNSDTLNFRHGCLGPGWLSGKCIMGLIHGLF